MEASLVAKEQFSGQMNIRDVGPASKEVSRRYSDSPGSLFRVDSLSALRMRFLRQRKCDVWCDCNCHTHVRAQTPDMLQSILGTLFVGYAGLPALTPSCSNTKCRRATDGFLQINYYFPQWFLTRIVSMAMKFQDSKIPNICMRVMNVRNMYEGVFMSAFENDADAVEYQITIGQASVLDATDDSGHSPLHVRIHAMPLEVHTYLRLSLLSGRATWKPLRYSSDWDLSRIWRIEHKSKDRDPSMIPES